MKKSKSDQSPDPVDTLQDPHGVERPADENSSSDCDETPATQRFREPASPLGSLGRLPAEIRNQIYAHVLRADEPITIRRRAQWPRNRPWAKRFLVAGSIQRECRRLPVDRCLSMELLRVGRAVNVEAAGILFRRNRFVFQDRVAMKEFGRKVKRYAGSLWDVPEEAVGGEIVLGFV